MFIPISLVFSIRARVLEHGTNITTHFPGRNVVSKKLIQNFPPNRESNQLFLDSLCYIIHNIRYAYNSNTLYYWIFEMLWKVRSIIFPQIFWVVYIKYVGLPFLRTEYSLYRPISSSHLVLEGDLSAGLLLPESMGMLLHTGLYIIYVHGSKVFPRWMLLFCETQWRHRKPFRMATRLYKTLPHTLLYWLARWKQRSCI